MIEHKRSVGLHCRLQEGLPDIIKKLESFSISVIQSFLLDESGYYISLKPKSVDAFLLKKAELGFSYFVHAAYWSNMTDVSSREFRSLCKEARLAVDLNASGIVVHIGATRQSLEKKDQALFIAQAVAELLHKVPDIPILLENGPHAGRNFGGDIQDFGLLLPLIEDTSRVKFCFDTAHAYVYGYNLMDQAVRQNFMQEMSFVIPQEMVRLVHLNDTVEKCGSQIDKHGLVGVDNLSDQALPDLLKSDYFKQADILLELPYTCSPQQEFEALVAVRSWI